MMSGMIIINIWNYCGENSPSVIHCDKKNSEFYPNHTKE